MAKPVPMPPSPFAPPEPPKCAADLPRLDWCPDAALVRGDEAELSDVLHQRFLGQYVISIAGDLWQYDPDRRGWWRIPEERAVTWVASLSGAPVVAGQDKDGNVKTKALSISNSKAKGAVAIARSRCHWPEERGDFWTGRKLGRYTVGIAQFKDMAVMVTQTGPGQLALKEVMPEPSHRVRASRVIPCRWLGLPDMADLAARCPAFHGACWDWWGHHGDEEASRRMLAVLEFLGASMLGYAPVMARALLLFGTGGTGKSTLLKLVLEWFPKASVSSVIPQEMATNRFAPARLDGAVLNVVDDIPKDPITDAGLWKSAITGGRIDVERKGRDGYGIIPTAGHLYSGNKLPRAMGATDGFWRRWLVVRYDRKFHGTTQCRPILPALLAEMEELAGFAIAAFVATGGEGGRGYTEPECHAQTMQEWADVSDSVAAWLREATEPVAAGVPKTAWPKRSDVYRSYRAWCTDCGRQPVSTQEWGSRLVDAGHEFVMSRGSWRSPIERKADQ
jgi:P4 family phage/plasmid primase-like protien